MKNIIIILAALFFIGFQSEMTAQSNDMDAFTVQVDGLGCPFCAYGLEKKFKELKGIKKVKIEMETGMMDFEYPADKLLTIEQVEKQVEKAGYTPVSVAITRADGSIEKTKDKAKTMADGEVEMISFFVAGNCGMCKARIEKAANSIEGVQEAIWDKETKKLSIKVDNTVTQSDVEKVIAEAGHDTNTAKAKDEIYKQLPGCCQYERAQ